MSNPPVLSAAPLLASLELFGRAGLARLREKSVQLTGFMQRSIESRLGAAVEIITPLDAARARQPAEPAARPLLAGRAGAATSASRRRA